MGADGKSQHAPSAVPGHGHRRRPGPVGPFGDLDLLVAGGPSRPPCGVLIDRRTRTYTAVLSLHGHNFALLDATEKERQVARWAGVLASLARAGSSVHRVQWLATTVPDDGHGVRHHLAERAVLDEKNAARRSYTSLLDGAGARTCRHETLLAVQISATAKRGGAPRAAGRGHAGGCAAVLREADALRRALGEADVVVDGLLTPLQLAELLRRSGEEEPISEAPTAADEPGGYESAEGVEHRPAFSGSPWPMATEPEWGCVRIDALWHATYWISEWPRVDVGPDFLAPLLLGSSRRTVSVVMEPLPPELAVRQVEQARTADLADSELRRRGGFLATARRAREEELVTRREEELADGHASLRFSGYVTVTASSRERLEEACEETEQAAGQCRLELRRLYGDQDRGFATSLPLCRGLS
jgi:hypothetical protein